MLVTVAICTWNRAHLLDQALVQFRQLRVPQGLEWELLVVNNNCTDATDEVIARHSSVLPARRLFEPNPGLSNARNRAVAEAAGDYIIWTDDDALVDSDWLAAYYRGIHEKPTAAIFGGTVAPWFEGTPPEWLRKGWNEVGAAYGVRDFGQQMVPLTSSRVPFGINYVVRADAQRRFHYDPMLGRRPGRAMGGEETPVIRAMLEDGLVGWWVPDARVRHFIPAGRQTLGFLRSQFRQFGEYEGWLLNGEEGPRLFGLPRWLWRQIFEEEAKYRVHRLVSGPEVWLAHLRRSSSAWGRARGFLRSDRKLRTP
jgi:glycosyltransferase involved in cell wall biosynthesis